MRKGASAMRTKTIIVVDKDTQTIWCNDPDAEIIHAGGKGEPTIEECGCCGCEHLSTFNGDCREDDARFFSIDGIGA